MWSKNAIFYGILYLIFVGSFLFLIKNNGKDNIQFIHFAKYIKTEQNNIAPEEVTIKKSYKPKVVRGIYLTAYSAGSDTFRTGIINNIKNGTKINSVVIDIKDYSGYILYNSQLTELKEIDAIRTRMPDVKKVLDEFHQANIYVIARLTVFQDPVLAKARPDLAFKTHAGNTWYDNKGLAWMNPNKKEVWDYNLAIAKEAAELGFDEINFDYMRFPSDGNMGSLDYDMTEGQTKAQVMDNFFSFLEKNLSGQIPTSIDTFGLVLDNIDSGYDLNIGQKLTELADHFDYVSPMMYPSHYPLTYLGFANSAEHPGAVIAYGLDISSSTMATKKSKLRPWLQAFNLRAVYTQELIEAQEIATENVTTTDGWLLWNARNYYPEFIF
ncbi:putative glycoside hydrolase [Patescibacteria group bacterium]|nr:putative glycoside hydrolase [Patescibacteria group bacterium]